MNRWVKKKEDLPPVQPLDPEVNVKHLTALAEMAGGDDAFLRSLVRFYKTEAHARLEALSAAIGQQNARRAGEELLAIDGNSANVGAKGVAVFSNRLYRMAERGDLEAVQSELPVLRATILESIAQLESAISKEKEAV
jgi:HPt (histidine-containing phosphotransfer) domain-containing protein